MKTTQTTELHDGELFFVESMDRKRTEEPDFPERSSNRDPTGYKQMEERYKKSEARFLNLLLNQTEAVIIVNKNGIMRFVNPAAEALLGRTKEELEGDVFGFPVTSGGTTDNETFHNAHRPAIAEMHTAAIEWEGEDCDCISIRDIMDGNHADEAQKKSARLLRDTGIMAKVGGWEFDVETLEQTWTEEVYRIHEIDLNYTPVVREGMDFYAPASRQIIETAVQKAIEHGEPFDLELEFITAKGNLRWVHTAGKADREHGKVFGTIQDITERKQTEISLHESEERYRRITEGLNGYLYTVQIRDGRVVKTTHNAACKAVTGYTAEDFAADPYLWISMVPEQERSRIFEHVRNILSGKSVPSIEHHILRKDGKLRRVSDTPILKVDSQGMLISFDGVIEDITESRQSEKRQHLAYMILQILNRPKTTTDAIRDILQLIKKYTGFEAVGIRLHEGDDFPYYETNGFTEEFVRDERYLCERDASGRAIGDKNGNPVLECMCGNIIRGRTDSSRSFFTRGGSFWSNNTTKLLSETTEKDRLSRMRNRCNGEGYESVALIPLRSGKEIIGLLQLNDRRPDRFTPEMIRFFEGLGASIGIALSRKRTEEALYRITNDWQETFDTINEAITIHDTDFNILRANKTCEIMLGKNAREILSVKCFSLHHDKSGPPQGCPCVESLKTGKPSMIELFEPHLNKFLEIKAFPRFDEKNNITGLVHIVRDITEMKNLTDQFHQAQKMEAIGQLAGGVAHDFNNLLMVISGYGDLIKSGLPEDNGLQKFAQQIVDTSLRGGQLTKKLLAFARKGRYVTSMVDVHGIMDSVIDLLGHSVDKRIVIERKYRDEPSIVNVDACQLENALLNLGINARDAMPDGGKLVFETDRVSLDSAYCRRQPFACTPGDYVLMCVSDSGTGMDEETQKHLFEPFFTTKEVGKGTGLGLASVYGFVTQSNGFINVYSRVGKGTTIKVYLPAVEKAEISVKPPVAVEVKKGHGHILFVDDEPAIRNICSVFLTELGYRVTCCSDGAEAIEYLSKNWRNVNLIILDMIMPNMNGYDCYYRIREITDTVPVLVSSGFSMNTDIEKVVDAGVKGFLQKPFRMEDLAGAISDTMSRKPEK